MTTKIIREYPNNFNLPKRIEELTRVVHNLWWVWNQDGQRLFKLIDPLLWDNIAHNPVAFLHQVERHRLNNAASLPSYLEYYDRTLARMDAYLAQKDTWFQKTIQRSKIKPSPTSRSSSGCTNRCQFTPAVWESSPAIT